MRLEHFSGLERLKGIQKGSKAVCLDVIHGARTDPMLFNSYQCIL